MLGKYGWPDPGYDFNGFPTRPDYPQPGVGINPKRPEYNRRLLKKLAGKPLIIDKGGNLCSL